MSELLRGLECDRGGCPCHATSRRGKGLTHCPAHEDQTPSLSVFAGRESDPAWDCKAGCEWLTVTKELEARGLVHSIRHLDGRLDAVHERKGRWIRADGRPGLSGRSPKDMLYGLERLAAAAPGGPAILVEGEKAAAALQRLDILALGTVCGASVVPSMEALRPLAGRPVVLWPDNDDAGRRHMERIARTVHGLGCEVHVIRWAGAPPKGDAADCPADQLAGIIGAAKRWEPEPAEDGAALLSDLSDFLGTFVAFPSPEARDAVALWLAHCHSIEAFDSTPRLALLSAEKGSGKSRTLELAEVLVPKPRYTSSMSPAALFRLVEAEQPVILMDEADTYFGSRATEHEELRGLINSGHRRGAVAYRCVGQKGDQVKAFPAFAAVALAGLGELPDTILDRSVLVKMRRRAPDEVIRPFRRREAAPAASALATRMTKWAAQAEDHLREAWPVMPEGLTDRPADVWEPLLAIADAAGGDWPARGRLAAIKLNDARQDADSSWGVRLLADIRVVFDSKAVDRLVSASLAEALAGMEEAPWGDLRGRPLDARGLARRLKPFGIRPRQIRPGDAQKQLRGYERSDFADTWKRYLSLSETSVTSVTSVTTSSEDVTDEGAGDGREPSHDPGPSQEFEFAVTDVTDVTDVSEGGSPSLPPILEVLPDISDDDYFRALTQTTGHVEEADQA